MGRLLAIPIWLENYIQDKRFTLNTLNLYLQCSKDQESGEIHPDDHVEVILVEDVGQVADDEEDDAGDEHDQDVADQGASKSHFDFDTVKFCISSEFDIAHHVTFDCVFGQVRRTRIGELLWNEFCKV